MLTDAVIARLIGKGLQWMNHDLRVFALNDEQGAFTFLGLSKAERDRAKVLRFELEKALGLNPKMSGIDKGK
jgi:predicted dienelactone hydrolase